MWGLADVAREEGLYLPASISNYYSAFHASFASQHGHEYPSGVASVDQARETGGVDRRLSAPMDSALLRRTPVLARGNDSPRTGRLDQQAPRRAYWAAAHQRRCR